MDLSAAGATIVELITRNGHKRLLGPLGLFTWLDALFGDGIRKIWLAFSHQSLSHRENTLAKFNAPSKLYKCRGEFIMDTFHFTLIRSIDLQPINVRPLFI